ncbi:DUF2513 domain-containing protein [Clostridium baratii]|uniref:DUF2513 domain-containing protein n=1 Tax=Clostridium baratii TaxID=1561 RepID=UPI0030CCB993
MKLNPDCIRDILLTVEESTDFIHPLTYKINNNSHEKLSPYSHAEIAYHIRQCNLSNLLHGVNILDAGDIIVIKDLSPKGHQFLADIRSDNIWNNTKSIATKVGSVSLDALIKISTGVLTQMINKQLGY